MAAAGAEPAAKKAKKDKISGINWCFTIFADPERWLVDWQTKDMPACIVYLAAQLERCPETKRLHVQGYIQLKQTKTLTAFQKTIERETARCAPQRSKNDDKAADYCLKDESREPGGLRIERGQRKAQGKRNDLGALAQAVIETKSNFNDFIVENPVDFLRYGKNMMALYSASHRPSFRPFPTGYFLWGEPGCGKSRMAHYLAAEGGRLYYKAKDTDKNWFDGYAGEEVVIFDDFAGKFDRHEMLQLLDPYPLRLPVKGGHVSINAHIIIFTANQPPEEIYGGNTAWLSRISGNRRGVFEIWNQAKVEAEVANLDEEDPLPPAEETTPTEIIEGEDD